MINLLVDECFCIDYYSILEVKAKKINSNNNIDNLYNCYNNLEREIGTDKLNSILISQEYHQLLNINLEIFEMLDRAKTEQKSIYIEEADFLNFKRFELKCVIQKKFFNNCPKETKINYGK